MPLTNLPEPPNVASRSYINSLLSENIICGPEEVVDAVTGTLLKLKLLTEDTGHIDLQGRPGATLDYPSIARKHLMEAVEQLCEKLPFMGCYIPGNAASGGGGLRTKQSIEAEAATKARQADQMQAELKQMVWQRRVVTSSLGPELVPEVTILYEYAILVQERSIERVKGTQSKEICPPLDAQKITKSMPEERSRWHEHRSGGLPLRGWPSIREALGVEDLDAKTNRNKKNKLLRWNTRTNGPITYDGQVPVVDRGELLAWIDIAKDTACKTVVRRQSDEAAAEELSERDGQHAADLKHHFEKRPNGRGKARS